LGTERVLQLNDGLYSHDIKSVRTLITELSPIIIIIVTSVFNNDASLPYNRDLFAGLIVKKRMKVRMEGYTVKGIALIRDRQRLCDVAVLVRVINHWSFVRLLCRSVIGEKTKEAETFQAFFTLSKTSPSPYPLSNVSITQPRRYSNHAWYGTHRNTRVRMSVLYDHVRRPADLLIEHHISWTNASFAGYEGLDNLAVSQPSCNLRVAWQLGTERVLQLNALLDFPCVGLDNLAVSQPSCNLRVAWQLGTERVLQLNAQHLRPVLFSCTMESIKPVPGTLIGPVAKRLRTAANDESFKHAREGLVKEVEELRQQKLKTRMYQEEFVSSLKSERSRTGKRGTLIGPVAKRLRTAANDESFKHAREGLVKEVEELRQQKLKTRMYQEEFVSSLKSERSRTGKRHIGSSCYSFDHRKTGMYNEALEAKESNIVRILNFCEGTSLEHFDSRGFRGRQRNFKQHVNNKVEEEMGKRTVLSYTSGRDELRRELPVYSYALTGIRLQCLDKR
ncbi:hypothetical protein CLF_110192, partial [Clonorchis sinensis]